MRKLLAHSAVALFIGSAAFAQQAQQAQQPGGQQAQQQDQRQDQQQMQAAGPIVEPTENDVFVTQLVGVAVFAGADGAAAPPGEGGAIDAAELAEFVSVGHVSDVMISMDGQPRGLIVGLTPGADGTAVDTDATPAPDADPAARAPDQAPGTAPGAGWGAGWAGWGTGAPVFAREIAVDFGQVAIFYDENAPHILFAVVGTSADELHQAPLIQRGAAAGADVAAGEPAAQAWRTGRDPMMAPGWHPVPAARIPADDLMGAPVFGTQHEQIGSIGDIRLGPDGTAEYVLIDVGGFLGIGSRQVAVGFDEMTVLRDQGWQDFQVHVAATRDQVEALPEYQEN